MTDDQFKSQAPLVLVVDDDPTTRALLEAALKREGFRVTEAEDGQRGLAVFEVMQPDIVLLDVDMPELDGFSCCKALRELPGGPHTPVLMLTGLDDMESVERAYAAGATDFLTKPIHWAVLGHRLRYILRSAKAYADLHRAETKNRALVSALPDMMIRLDDKGTCLDVQIGQGSVLAAQNVKIRGKKLSGFLPYDAAEKANFQIHRVLETGVLQNFEYQLPSNEGTRFYEARMVACGQKEVLTLVRDVTDRKQAEERIRRFAYYDGVTGLYNRHYFQQRVDQEIHRAARNKRLIGVLFLDLDRFKAINDTLGHHSGDRLLEMVADRLRECTREGDDISRISGGGEQPDIARLGGDEFTIMLPGMQRMEDAAAVAQRIQTGLAKPFAVASREIHLTTSIGIAIYPADGEDVTALLKSADVAMYKAKEEGRNNYQFYTAALNAKAHQRLMLENDLRMAMKRNELTLFYQPKVDILSRKILGMEALIRWQHPKLGLVPPMRFIPVAEEIGVIDEIGEWVLRTACAQTKRWHDVGLASLTIAVNLSRQQLRNKLLAATITRALGETGLARTSLELELTESMIMHDVEHSVAALRQLKELGLTLSIDDFGTGYSSLSCLRRFPLDALKIDRSFVHDAATDPDDGAIVRAIIAMAKTLGLVVIGEGVETEEQYAFLKKEGCDVAQGFLFGKPMAAVECERFLTEVQSGALAREARRSAGNYGI